MSSLVQATGLVLHSVRHGETSLILTVFTRERGRLGLMAKGARGKSKMGSAAGLALFTEAQFVFYQKSGRDLQLLKEWTTIAPHLGLREDFERLTVASAVAELLSKCTRDDDAHPELFDAASAIFTALDGKSASPIALFWAFELSLFRELGFGLRFESCAESGKPLVPPFRGPIRYRLADGGFFHPDLEKTIAADGSVTPETFAVMARLSEASLSFAGRLSLSPRVQREMSTFLARYLETHLPVKGRLRSLEALHWGESEPEKKSTSNQNANS